MKTILLTAPHLYPIALTQPPFPRSFLFSTVYALLYFLPLHLRLAGATLPTQNRRFSDIGERDREILLVRHIAVQFHWSL